MSEAVVDEYERLSSWIDDVLDANDASLAYKEKCSQVVSSLQAFFNGRCTHTFRNDAKKCTLCGDEEGVVPCTCPPSSTDPDCPIHGEF